MSELSSPINWAAVELWGDCIQDNNIVWILRVQTPVLESFGTCNLIKKLKTKEGSSKEEFKQQSETNSNKLIFIH